MTRGATSTDGAVLITAAVRAAIKEQAQRRTVAAVAAAVAGAFVCICAPNQ